MVNNLGIELGDNPDEILTNLQNHNYSKDSIQYPNKLASDNKYQKQVRDINSSTPARFNADGRRLHMNHQEVKEKLLTWLCALTHIQLQKGAR